MYKEIIEQIVDTKRKEYELDNSLIQKRLIIYHSTLDPFPEWYGLEEQKMAFKILAELNHLKKETLYTRWEDQGNVFLDDEFEDINDFIEETCGKKGDLIMGFLVGNGLVELRDTYSGYKYYRIDPDNGKGPCEYVPLLLSFDLNRQLLETPDILPV